MEEIVPALAVQVTPVLKDPVPRTMDEQEVVVPMFTLVGEQFAETEVMATGVVMAMMADAA